MKKFLVLYLAPAHVLDRWVKTDPETRKTSEEKMRGEWNAWLQSHGPAIIETAGAGKTKRVTSAGVADARNDVMMYSLVTAESHDEAAKMFEGHPHLGIPEASIEIMEANPLPGAAGM